jgi:hypothetical protein
MAAGAVAGGVASGGRCDSVRAVIAGSGRFGAGGEEAVGSPLCPISGSTRGTGVCAEEPLGSGLVGSLRAVGTGACVRSGSRALVSALAGVFAASRLCVPTRSASVLAFDGADAPVGFRAVRPGDCAAGGRASFIAGGTGIDATSAAPVVPSRTLPPGEASTLPPPRCSAGGEGVAVPVEGGAAPVEGAVTPVGAPEAVSAGPAVATVGEGSTRPHCGRSAGNRSGHVRINHSVNSTPVTTPTHTPTRPKTTKPAVVRSRRVPRARLFRRRSSRRSSKASACCPFGSGRELAASCSFSRLRYSLPVIL